MSESESEGHTAEVEQREYQVQVWATKEFTPRVTAESEEEAQEEARKVVEIEHMGADIQTVRANHADGDTWFGSVWATKEYVETVEATDVEEAEQEAVEQAKALHGIVDKDVESVHVEGAR